MRIIVVGLNEQGLQRQKIAGNDCVGLTSTLHGIPLDTYDVVLICTANDNKHALARYALTHKKHVFMEAPLWGNNLAQLDELEQLALTNNVIFYIAYSLRFVAEFANTLKTLQHKQLGEIYHCRVAYAANADNKHDGALIDLIPHLLNLLCYWFGPEIMQNNLSVVHKDQFGRHVIVADFNARCTIELEANFFASRETITAELFGSRDELHVRYTDIVDKRHKLQQLEYAYFQELCAQTQLRTDCVMDKWIYAELDRLASEQMLLA